MKARICEACGKELDKETYGQTHTREDHDFCNYECMESFYGDEIPENEDFICVPN